MARNLVPVDIADENFEEQEVHISSFDELSNSTEVKKAMKNLQILNEPSSDLAEKLNKLETIDRIHNSHLEKYLGIFGAWQNYYSLMATKVDVVKTVAEDQKEYIAARLSISLQLKTATETKNVVRTNGAYREAVKVYNECVNKSRAIHNMYETCDRAYKLISRVITNRLGIKDGAA